MMVGKIIRPVLSFTPRTDLMRRITRSSSSINAASKDTSMDLASTLGKRKADTKLTKNTKKLAKQEVASAEERQSGSNTTLVPAILTFDFQEAKRHLIQADPRFEDLFQRMTCKPFEQLEQVHPFRYVSDALLKDVK